MLSWVCTDLEGAGYVRQSALYGSSCFDVSTHLAGAMVWLIYDIYAPILYIVSLVHLMLKEESSFSGRQILDTQKIPDLISKLFAFGNRERENSL